MTRAKNLVLLNMQTSIVAKARDRGVVPRPVVMLRWGRKGTLAFSERSVLVGQGRNRRAWDGRRLLAFGPMSGPHAGASEWGQPVRVYPESDLTGRVGSTSVPILASGQLLRTVRPVPANS